ncbi:MAG: DUF929 domain-containing protein [Thaumarchaeota archaeon]|nr:DUF929 domain-containing protein [Nitrososphaerota archaeon]
MPRCTKCGKKFSTIAALNDHYKAIHPNDRFVAPKPTTTRNLVVGLVIVIIVIGALVGYLILLQEQQTTTTTSTSGNYALIGQTISPALYQNISSVSYTTLASVGNGGVTAPTTISGTPLTSNGKPEVLYIGAEYCPYCAAERWSMIIALSKFGTFSNLQYMLSSSSDVFANTATFTFLSSTYVSNYITLTTVENEDRSGKPLQSVTTEESTIWTQYMPNPGYPFIDFGNQLLITGYQFSVGVLSGLNWTQIASQLDNPNSAVAKSIDGAANTMIKAICTITNDQPSSVCQHAIPLAAYVQQPRSASLFSLISEQIGKENLVPQIGKYLL